MVGACSLNLAVLERGLAVLRRGYSPAWRCVCVFSLAESANQFISNKDHFLLKWC